MSLFKENDLGSYLLSLEQQLMEPGFRRDRAKVSALLAEKFREFGSSGRVWNKAEILDLLVGESDWQAPQIEDFAFVVIFPGVVLVTYRMRREAKEFGQLPLTTLRSSLWVSRGERWEMIFHQGTPICGE